ncbi:MAG: hypothetical protein AAF667_06570 [Pseudomonadota bacterium]
MYNINQSKPESARAFLLTLHALNAPTDRRPKTSEEAAKSALAEIVAQHANWVGEFNLGELFTFADKLMIHRDEQAGASPAIYPIDGLADLCGSRTMALMAAKLCGARIDGDDWRDDGVGHPILLTFQDWTQDD